MSDFNQRPSTGRTHSNPPPGQPQADLLLDILGLTDVPETSPKTLTDCVRSRNRGAR